jgi:hypothetical protein
MLALFFVLIAGLEWWRQYMSIAPSPITFSVAALTAVLYAGFRIWRVVPRLRNLRQGVDGERAVGQFLERLRGGGFQVFHDVIGVGFNVDHVIIGPAGVFTVETKTWSKPIAGNAQLQFDGKSITVAGVEPDRDPVIQAKAQAAWLRSQLTDSTGKTFDVRPVVVFPGWYVVNSGGSFKDIWVLEPKALPTFLSNEPSRLSHEDVKLASFHLSRLIRTTVEKRR